jgi:hypothetical protein
MLSACGQIFNEAQSLHFRYGSAFCAQSPNLRFASLMDCGLRSKLPARPTLTPYIRFLFIDSHIC